MYSICKYLWNIYIYIYLYVFIIQAFDLPANACQSNQRSKILGALGCYRLVIWHSWLEQCTTHRPVLSFLRNMWEISWTFPSGCLNVNFGVAFKNLHVFLNPNKLEDFNSWHKWRFCVNNLVFLTQKKTRFWLPPHFSGRVSSAPSGSFGFAPDDACLPRLPALQTRVPWARLISKKRIDDRYDSSICWK